MTTETTTPVTLAMLRASVKRQIFMNEATLNEAVRFAVGNVSAEFLGNLILEANDTIHPASALGFRPGPFRDLEDLLRQTLKGVLKAQLYLEAWHGS